MIRRAVVDFPHPDSPTMPSVSPRRTVSDTSSTGVHLRLAACEDALLDLEMLGEVLDLDEVLDRVHAASPTAIERSLPNFTLSSHARWQASRCASGTGATSGGRSIGHGSNR